MSEVVWYGAEFLGCDTGRKRLKEKREEYIFFAGGFVNWSFFRVGGKSLRVHLRVTINTQKSLLCSVLTLLFSCDVLHTSTHTLVYYITYLRKLHVRIIWRKRIQMNVIYVHVEMYISQERSEKNKPSLKRKISSNGKKHGITWHDMGIIPFLLGFLLSLQAKNPLFYNILPFLFINPENNQKQIDFLRKRSVKAKNGERRVSIRCVCANNTLLMNWTTTGNK